MSKIEMLQKQINESNLFSRNVEAVIQDGNLHIVDEDLKEFPVHILVNGKTMKFWTTITKLSDVETEKRGVLNETMLTANGMMDLSSFSIDDGFVCLSGNLSSESTFENIVLEIETLIDSTEDAIDQIFMPLL